ncbi:hypothetical protein BE17_37045 [Sorangium cellulosum]|uniref:Uncharacterized protein n=1 Tax=Sorangium cellulosum TaxID=56 RepID=A0A150RX25_SORCE|nr:hypothetical protein BE17_37045 [Sorangium cellulosum]
MRLASPKFRSITPRCCAVERPAACRERRTAGSAVLSAVAASGAAGSRLLATLDSASSRSVQGTTMITSAPDTHS